MVSGNNWRVKCKTYILIIWKWHGVDNNFTYRSSYNDDIMMLLVLLCLYYSVGEQYPPYYATLNAIKKFSACIRMSYYFVKHNRTLIHKSHVTSTYDKLYLSSHHIKKIWHTRLCTKIILSLLSH